jgi:hypothetical protein
MCDFAAAIARSTPTIISTSETTSSSSGGLPSIATRHVVRFAAIAPSANRRSFFVPRQ